MRRRKLKGSRRDTFGRPVTASASFEIIRALRVEGRPTHRFVLGLGSQKTSDPAGRFWCEAIRRMIERGVPISERARLLAEMLRKGARLPGGAWHRSDELAELRRVLTRPWGTEGGNTH